MVFGRWPAIGRVKTRLAATVGPARALDVYRRLLLATLCAGNGCRLATRLCFDVDISEGLQAEPGVAAGVDTEIDSTMGSSIDPGVDADVPLRRLLRERRWQLRAQAGQGLGQRMQSSLRRARDETATHAVVLVGTDGAATDAAYLDRAFAALARNDVVLGPTADGGYLLIGSRIDLPDAVFEQRWSSDAVLEGTRSALRGAAIRWEELPLAHDVDTEADLDGAANLAPHRAIPGPDGRAASPDT